MKGFGGRVKGHVMGHVTGHVKGRATGHASGRVKGQVMGHVKQATQTLADSVPYSCRVSLKATRIHADSHVRSFRATQPQSLSLINSQIITQTYNIKHITIDGTGKHTEKTKNAYKQNK